MRKGVVQVILHQDREPRVARWPEAGPSGDQYDAESGAVNCASSTLIQQQHQSESPDVDDVLRRTSRVCHPSLRDVSSTPPELLGSAS